tara:strand:+ start:3241 stop:3858 length:618 start_codon:yes stop_codon:yes gene_type:complete
MKNILITTNVKYSKKRGFSFSIEKNWIDYSRKLNLNPILCNYNNLDLELLKNKKIHGIIFTGGNDLKIYNKKKENIFRDKKETELFKLSLKLKIPILAVCRGSQLVGSIFNHKIIKVKNHVSKNHDLKIVKNSLIKKKKIEVNSYHNFAIKDVSINFEIIAKHRDDTIEISHSRKDKILCLMFHPERKNNSQKILDNLILKHLRL